MNRSFNVRLYLEGLKKTKLVGIAAAIITVVLCSIIPIVYMVEEFDTNVTDYVYDVKISEFAIPLMIIFVFAPFFVSSMFSYLNKRNESDFYHAIPYKRTAVFNSFMLAAFTWVAAIIVCSVLVTTALWSVAPGVSFDVSIPPLLILSALLSCLLLMCFMAVSVSLTGTATSNLFIFALLACFVRVICLMFTTSVETTACIWDSGAVFGGFTEIGFYMPLSHFFGVVDVYDTARAFANIPLYVYTAVVSIGLYVLACWLYTRRRSEMAGKSAPNKILQHVYRIAFTTPFALIIFMLLTEEVLTGDAGMDISVYIVLVVVVLLVYYLYELTTTKSPKNMLKATKYLVVLLLVGLTYMGAVAAVRSTVLSKSPAADEIESVVLNVNENEYYERVVEYDDLVCRNVKVYNGEVREYIAQALDFSIESVKDGSYNTRRRYDGYWGGGDNYTQYYFATVKINMTNGQSISRKLKFLQDDYLKMLAAARSSDEYGQAYLKIPQPESIYSMSVNITGDKSAEKLYECFYSEYSALTDEQKLQVKMSSESSFLYMIECYGREDLSSFYFIMNISKNTPKTLSMLSNMMAEADSGSYADSENVSYSNKQAAEKIFNTYLSGDEEYFDKYRQNSEKQLNFSLGVNVYGSDGGIIGIYNTDYSSYSSNKIDYDEGAEMIEFLLEHGSEVYDENKAVIYVSAYYNEEKYEYKAETAYYKGYESINAEMIYYVDEKLIENISDILTDYDEYDKVEDVVTEKMYY